MVLRTSVREAEGHRGGYGQQVAFSTCGDFFQLTPFRSRLYSEKAYVLSRGFVRRALEIPLGGLQSEINWLYYTKGKLAKVLCDSRQLIEKSKPEPDGELDPDIAVPRLTAGGIITLERTLVKLQALLDRRQETESQT